ncbi:MAG: hypothetical protein K9W42_09945 [Candidatus Heimdallarchaeota archaeon]|nr:hypothetical protein [Candidatus Heimdallarchaeota archaeon]
MKDRIVILRKIMELEKKYALEEIDSETFERKMQIYEQQLRRTEELTDKEFMLAVQNKEIPFSVERFMGKITIEDLLPTFNIPRHFYRHLKIRREIKELEKNIEGLKHNIHKLKLLIAEKKVNVEAASVKLETLEFDLRLAENRYGAREKYLKRNPSKGDLLRFALENYQKFSFGHGIKNEDELKEIARDLKKEIELRKEYRRTLAEMLATMKTSQMEISVSKQKNGLPDFKSLLDYQQMINEIKDYISLLAEDIREYSKCLSLLEEDVLSIDESLEFSEPMDFGIETLTQETTTGTQPSEEIDPFLKTIVDEQESSDHIGLFLIDTIDSSLTTDKDALEQKQEEEPTDKFVIPETPEVVFQPNVDIEVIGGLEEFNSPIEVYATSSDKINDATKQIIFQSFEGLLEKLLDNGSDTPAAAGTTATTPTTPSPAEITPKEQKPKVKRKVKFAPLKSDLVKKSLGQKDSSIAQPASTESLEQLTDEVVMEEGSSAKESLPPPPPPQTLPPPPPPTEKRAALEEEGLPPPPPDMPTEFAKTETLPPPPPEKAPAIEVAHKAAIERPIDELTEEIIVKDEVKPEPLPPPPPPAEEAQVQTSVDLVKPQRTSMITKKLIEASSEAWKLAGKAVFTLQDNAKRNFEGYIQEVVIFDKNRLGFMLVSESSANQAIIDRIFDQIKPLWITEDYLESAEKRKEYVINEVVEALRVTRDVALHTTRLQEFANFRNINYPNEIATPNREQIGILPVDKIRIKQGMIVCQQNAILPLKPYRTAPWDGKLVTEEHTPIGKDCYYSQGQKIGKIIAIVSHPLLGKLLLINTGVPDLSLVDYFVQRLEITEENPKERVWLLKYLIAKQLRIPEGEALKPKTLINYSLQRCFPILPHEILNSFRMFVSGGAIEKQTKSKVILRNASRLFHPSEVYPLACLRVRGLSGRHLGMSLGISLSDKPVLLISEKLSREIAMLFTNATVEKEVMDDISKSVMGAIGVNFKDSLCTHNILKSLIVGKKVTSLQEYGKYLTQMNVTGIDLSEIKVVEKGTIFVQEKEDISQNIFETR